MKHPTILAASALALYDPGQKCNTNIECNAECLDQRWTIAAQDNGSFALVCDPTDTQWYWGTCHTYGAGGTPRYAGEETSSACKKRHGTICSRQCILSGKVADDYDSRQQWASACNDEGADTSQLMNQYSENTARMICDP